MHPVAYPFMQRRLLSPVDDKQTLQTTTGENQMCVEAEYSFHSHRQRQRLPFLLLLSF